MSAGENRAQCAARAGHCGGVNVWSATLAWFYSALVTLTVLTEDLSVYCVRGKKFLGIARQIVCTGVRDGHHIAPLGIVYNENGFHVHDGRDKPFAFGKLSRRKH